MVNVPFAFAGQGGRVPATELDANFKALADAVALTGTLVTLTANAADNRAALQAAFTNASVMDLVLLPPGSWPVEDTVTIPKGMAVRGAGRLITTLNFATGGISVVTNDPVVLSGFAVTSAGGPWGIALDGVSGLGNGDSMLDDLYVSSTAGDGISVLGAYQAIITNCRCAGRGAGGSGIRLANHFSADSGGYLVDGCILDGILAGLRHDSGAGLTFTNNTVFAPTAPINQYALYLVFAGTIPSTEVLISDNDLATSSVVGIWVDSAQGYDLLQIVNNNIRGDQGDGGGITITNGSSAAMVMTGNLVEAGANKAIVIDLGVNGGTIVANHIQHTGANMVGIHFRSAAANIMTGNNLFYAGIANPNPITADPAATFLELHDAAFDFAGLPASGLVRKGSQVYVDDGTPSTNPLTGGGTGAIAVHENGIWRGL